MFRRMFSELQGCKYGFIYCWIALRGAVHDLVVYCGRVEGGTVRGGVMGK